MTAGSGFSDEELRDLQRTFLDEAREYLEAIAAAQATLEASPGDAEALSALLRQLHTLKGSAGSVFLLDVAQAAHAFEDRLLELRLDAGGGGMQAEVRAGVEQLARLIAAADRTASAASTSSAPSTSAASTRAASDGERPDARAGERRGTERRAGETLIRVEVERVDELMDAVGELVIDRTRIARRLQELAGCVRDLAKVRDSLHRALGLPDGGGSGVEQARRLGELDSELQVALGNLERASSGMADDADGLRGTSQVLQEGLQRVRMMKVGRLFARLERPLRELAVRVGKEVIFVTEGEETAIDKAVVERIADPLLHLLRNAVAHGIEPPADRATDGKPRAGRISLSAAQRGNQVVLTVRDDGRGIDLGGVRTALVRTGRLDRAAADRLGDDELRAAIFDHGVSTRDAALVDELAGRGVGLDAVRDAISRLGGVITCDTAAGTGTTFTVRLPLTTAIAQALLFKVGGNVYAIPVAAVLETAQVNLDEIVRGQDGGPDRVAIRGTPLPLVRLGALLGAPAPPGPSRRWAMVCDHDGLRFALTCDKLIGPREIVIKNLGPLLSSLPLYAGATISGAGKVQLILDLATLAAHARAGSLLPTRPSGVGGAARVLVVDDSRSLRETAALLLQQGGYRVDTVPDGWDAWELLQDRRFELLLTDLEMPRLDGYELASKVRRHPDLRRMAILVMTSRSGEAIRHRALQSGADGFLSKPIRRRPLLDAVQTALTHRFGA